MTEGLLISSKAIDVRFLYPPEIPLIRGPPTKTSRHLFNLKFSANKIMASYFSESVASNFKSAANCKV